MEDMLLLPDPLEVDSDWISWSQDACTNCPLLHFEMFSNLSSVCEISVNWKLLGNAPSLFIALWEFDFVCACAVPSEPDCMGKFICRMNLLWSFTVGKFIYRLKLLWSLSVSSLS